MQHEPVQSDDVGVRFQKGDPRAFEELFNLHSDPVLRFVAANTNCLQDAEDVCQEVWKKAISKHESFRNTHFRGWLFTIARNSLIDFQRKQSRSHGQPIDDVDVAGEKGNEVSERIERSEEIAIMRDCIDRLSARLHDVITRVKLEGGSPVDAADATGRTRQSIDKDVYRAKQQLRDCMEKKQR